jgi:hypothetical protein
VAAGQAGTVSLQDKHVAFSNAYCCTACTEPDVTAVVATQLVAGSVETNSNRHDICTDSISANPTYLAVAAAASAAHCCWAALLAAVC